MIDVNDLDRYAESAFSSRISVEVSDEKKLHILQRPVVTSAQKPEVQEMRLFGQ